jgi:hypothetical protein
MRIIPLFIILIFTFTGFAMAKSAISCHCFQDREYDPQRADAADPYFLATTQEKGSNLRLTHLIDSQFA